MALKRRDPESAALPAVEVFRFVLALLVFDRDRPRVSALEFRGVDIDAVRGALDDPFIEIAAFHRFPDFKYQI